MTLKNPGPHLDFNNHLIVDEQILPKAPASFPSIPDTDASLRRDRTPTAAELASQFVLVRYLSKARIEISAYARFEDTYSTLSPGQSVT